MSEQCCKTCRWARWVRTGTGRIKRSVAGKCDVEIVMPKLPSCVDVPGIYKKSIWPDFGHDCQLYEPSDGCRAEVMIEVGKEKR